MAIQSYKMFDGTLVLGAGGDLLDVSCQVTNARCEPVEKVTSTDAVDVLCGEELPAEESASFTYRLKGTLLQDLAAAGVCAWTWEHAGEEHPFTLVPNSALAREVSGIVRVVPIVIGGEVSRTKRPTSDIDWSCVGTPEFAAVV